MVNLGKVHVGDVGTEFQLLVEDTTVNNTNTPLDLSLADDFFTVFTDPSGNETVYDATILNPPGTDGIIKFITTSPSPWDESGFWSRRARIHYAIGSQYDSNDIIFEVL